MTISHSTDPSAHIPISVITTLFSPASALRKPNYVVLQIRNSHIVTTGEGWCSFKEDRVL